LFRLSVTIPPVGRNNTLGCFDAWFPKEAEFIVAYFGHVVVFYF